jgi:hypothetical protein
VTIESYNVELEDDEGFVGDRANRRAFRDIIDGLRTALRKYGADPLDFGPSNKVSKKKLDHVLSRGNIEAAGVIQGAIEEFSQEFANVIKRFLRQKGWKGTERIAIGGGFRASRIGEVVIGRTSVILKIDEADVELRPIHNDSDEAGLLGAMHLAPTWMFQAFDAILAVDIGGTNIRAGIVQLNLKAARDLSKAKVWKCSLWRHRDEEDVKQEHAVESLGKMLKRLIAAARKKEIRLAPFIGIGCPGVIGEDGSIERGAQNVPGNWEGGKFNLPMSLHAQIPEIGGEEISIVMHNDAVVQGLSEIPSMIDVESWGILTVGTGLGNARFTNRKSEDKR